MSVTSVIQIKEALVDLELTGGAPRNPRGYRKAAVVDLCLPRLRHERRIRLGRAPEIRIRERSDDPGQALHDFPAVLLEYSNGNNDRRNIVHAEGSPHGSSGCRTGAHIAAA